MMVCAKGFGSVTLASPSKSTSFAWAASSKDWPSGTCTVFVELSFSSWKVTLMLKGSKHRFGRCQSPQVLRCLAAPTSRLSLRQWSCWAL